MLNKDEANGLANLIQNWKNLQRNFKAKLIYYLVLMEISR